MEDAPYVCTVPLTSVNEIPLQLFLKYDECNAIWSSWVVSYPDVEYFGGVVYIVTREVFSFGELGSLVSSGQRSCM
jgi:hypothetical protein